MKTVAVYHYEEGGNGETGPMVDCFLDARFETQIEADTWISAQPNPRWYHTRILSEKEAAEEDECDRQQAQYELAYGCEDFV